METKKAPASRGIVIGLALGAVMGALSGFSELGFVLAPAFLGFVLGSWGYAAGAVSFAAFGIAAYFVAGISAFPYVLGAAQRPHTPSRTFKRPCHFLLGTPYGGS